MPPSSEAAGARVRALAAELDSRILTRGASLDEVLAEAPELPARDAALLRALLFGVRRWHHRLERQIGQLLTRPLKRGDAALAALLRVGLLQLEAMRVPDHAAVASTVAAAPLLGLARAKSLVNAVLRRYLRERDALDRLLETCPEARYSHADWMIDLFRHDWPEGWADLLEANNTEPPMWVRVNLSRTTREAYREKLRAAGIEAEPFERAPAALLLAEPCATSRLPGYAEGEVSVQDAAAQLAAPLLALGPGQRVLDACAAPGGKTAHMLELCRDVDELWALDRDPARLDTVRANLDRLGLDARLLAVDAAATAEWWDGRPFDRILLDAPCSGLGVIRRHPDIKVRRTPADIARAAERQGALLDALWPLLAPGGRLVYATCTITRVENAGGIRRFLAAHTDARIEAGGELSIRTGEANMDGFYYACIDKKETSPPFRAPPPQQ
ncbi:MAG TPA: 16S rRNA (cytosine(967)-C(5))-methyltransferase RsmB [Gammaproteobacteria bacterium]|nr:16S rRNA (cytosine(967)-C(5))-methyltransferase RsmB [Gammaproteobacteria bacterium]